MKAKDYVTEYHKVLETESDEVEAQLVLLELLANETKQIINQRKCESNDAFISVFKEMEQKWQVACKLDSRLLTELYQCSIKESQPKLYPLIRGKVWNAIKAS